jgi:2-polyprenyl-3-methyl-5-hydroxy-6-metoxy-1,4-benzoquinol methylase
MTVSCETCGHYPLETIIDLGYMPGVNVMPKVTQTPSAQSYFPTVMVRCQKCELVQLGGNPPPQDKIFPPDYPYTTSSSKPLVKNFCELAEEICERFPNCKLSVCDIGSNDGTLLSFFQEKGHKVLGIEPTDIAHAAVDYGIKTMRTFFNLHVANELTEQFDVVTATNCFAHMPNVNEIVQGIKMMLKPDGIFVSENHYLINLLENVQYDTIYHEHLRFYSLTALYNLFWRNDMLVFFAKKITTHGGSIRVYAARKKSKWIDYQWDGIHEPTRGALDSLLTWFNNSVSSSKRELWKILANIGPWHSCAGIGAPSRGTILVNYVGLDHNMLKYVCEREGSLKIGRMIPGTRIPVVTESRLLGDKLPYALILSWHMADEIMKNLRGKGYEGKFIVPLPEPRIIQ